MSEKSPADVLEEAADWLLVNGRCRDDLTGPDGSGCVMYAIYGGPGSPNATMAAHVAEHALNQHLWNNDEPSFVTWNRNTVDDFVVIDTLRLVAKDLRNGES